MSNQLRLYLQSRRPLKLQEHKPIPIPSYVPKFEGSHYTPGKHYDPDVERNNMAKLRKELKEEKKGAIRELRKDARFLSAERNRIKDEKDQACVSPPPPAAHNFSTDRAPAVVQTRLGCALLTVPSRWNVARRRRWSARRRATSGGPASRIGLGLDRG